MEHGASLVRGWERELTAYTGLSRLVCQLMIPEDYVCRRGFEGEGWKLLELVAPLTDRQKKK